MTLGDKIRALRESQNLTQEDLASAMGVTDGAISAWESGRAVPRIGKIRMLAELLHVQASDILEGAPPPPKGVKIPVLGRVQAGVPVEAVEEILDYEEITPELAATGEFFGLQIRGDSMEPKFSDGDVVIIRKQPDADSGHIVVALVDGDDACVKRLKKYENGSLSLISTNPSYEPLFFSREEIRRLPVTLLGRVVELRAKF